MKEQTPGTRQLLFKGKDEKLPVKPGQSLLGKTVTGEVHRKVAQNEEDNTGLQALHSAERVGEGTLHTAQTLRYKSQQHNHKKHEQDKSHSQSRSYQRKAIRREYMKASAGRSTNRNAQKAVKKTAETSESVITFIAKKKSFLVILALVAMLMFQPSLYMKTEATSTAVMPRAMVTGAQFILPSCMVKLLSCPMTIQSAKAATVAIT